MSLGYNSFMKIIEWTADKQAIVDFYKTCDYEYHPKDSETIITAINDHNEIVGVVRLSKEENILHLRGMQVDSKLQKQGIGTQMLQKVAELIKDDTCYLVGYPHLKNFYEKIGFKELMPPEAPTQVQERFHHAQERFPETKFNIMVKYQTK